MTELVPRNIQPLAADFLASFRVVIINGPRQSGKTTLIKRLAEAHQGTYLSLDDGALRAAAHADPPVFISGHARPLIVDEVQRGGDDLVLAIKVATDENDDRGQFVLAGSTRFFSTPSLTESLAGRAGVLELWPFAEQELRDGPSFVDAAFTDAEAFRAGRPSQMTRDDYFQLVCRGSYPEVTKLRTDRARQEWYRTYLQAIIDTDLREMANVEEPSNLRELMRLAAASSAQEFNVSKAGNDLGLHRTTVTRYLNLLETVFLVRLLPAWSRNLMARAVHRPKLHLTDTGLAARLVGVDADGLAAPVAPARGPLVESFIVNELTKQASWSTHPVQLHHWRISQGTEVDLVMERTNGRVVGVEAKANDTVRESDFRGLAALRDRLAEEFVHGFVFYTGAHRLSFGDRLTALPISVLWEG